MAKKTRGASAASSKKQTKAAQRELKKKQRENKKKLEQQTKAASKLRRVIKTYDENSHKSDRDYIVEMLDANPAWVAKLAMVIRQAVRPRIGEIVLLLSRCRILFGLQNSFEPKTVFMHLRKNKISACVLYNLP